MRKFIVIFLLFQLTPVFAAPCDVLDVSIQNHTNEKLTLKYRELYLIEPPLNGSKGGMEISPRSTKDFKLKRSTSLLVGIADFYLAGQHGESYAAIEYSFPGLLYPNFLFKTCDVEANISSGNPKYYDVSYEIRYRSPPSVTFRIYAD